MSRTFVVATGNPHKVEELSELMPGVPLQPLSDFPSAPEPVEDAPDFAGNAIIKAKSALAHTGLPSLADDSGICVDCLDGAPGIYSARYVEGSDADRRHALHKAVGDAEDRGAQFVCVIAIAGLPDDLPLPEGVERRDGCYIATGVVHGEIVRGAERGAHGFGYDPIFELPERGLTTAELSTEEKHAVSHRGRAVRVIAPLLNAWVGQ
ncbi:MAG: non-canonical purine NTP pyrophosphatase [Bradymonadia bacterium]